jgi:hypothetical protein
MLALPCRLSERTIETVPKTWNEAGAPTARPPAKGEIGSPGGPRWRGP